MTLPAPFHLVALDPDASQGQSNDSQSFGSER